MWILHLFARMYCIFQSQMLLYVVYTITIHYAYVYAVLQFIPM